MGANQSSTSDGSSQAAGSGNAPKTSYYELLAIERTATEEEIKKAYRRKALELHPDRNYGNVEVTTALFAEVQTAYEVLSDPQERAWYDSHESAILNGVSDGDGTSGDAQPAYAHNIRITTADEVVRMMGHFRGNVEFSNSPTGFYGFLRDTFEQLAREEEAAAQWENLEVVDYPSFGHKEDTYADGVRQFYAMWNGFATKKTFSWRDKWRYADAPDRRVRRLMEKENKKIREDAAREFNDAVRALVAFVRKRDPRYTPNTQSEADRQQAQREAAAAQAARARAEHRSRMTEEVPEWAKAREPDEVELSEEEESEEEYYECVACRKTFKSEGQFDAHEKSKKHIKAVRALRRQLQKEGHELDLDDGEDDESVTLVGEEVSTTKEEVEGEDKVGQDKQEHDDDLARQGEQLDLTDQHEADNDDAQTPESEASNDTDGQANGTVEDSTVPLTGSLEPEEKEEVGSQRKLGKAAQKRAKKAAQQQGVADSGQAFRCASCNAGFPSKTRLFQHIQDFGHAQPISVTKSKGKKR